MSLKSICRDAVPSNPPMRWLEQGEGDSRQESMPEQKLVKLKINDREMQVPQGTLVIEAARRIGTEVPSFCYYPGLSLQAACRMCLVEVEKAPKLQTACTLVATEGMIVRTDTEQVRQARRVRAAGHGVSLRRGFEPLRRGKTSPSRREVVGAGVLRPAALHPLFPLRARVRRGHGRESAGRGPARRAQRDHSQP